MPETSFPCYHRRVTSLGELVGVAGRRWGVGECFTTAKPEAGVDQHQVRTWTAWYRHTTLAMPATAAHIPAALHPVRGTRFILQWSHWRRRHQAAAELVSHYKRRVQETQHLDYYIRTTKPAQQYRVHRVMRDYRLGHDDGSTRSIYEHPTPSMRRQVLIGLQAR